MKHNNGSLQSLTLMLGLGGLNGSIAIAAASGMFTLSNAPIIASLFMAGPGSLTLASLLDGTIKERIITALLAGIIATGMVIFAAGIGPKMLSFLNLHIIRIAAGVALGAIALLVAGINISEKIPWVIMIIGLLASILWRAT